MATEGIAWAIAAGGWVVALVEYLLGYRERRVQREDELLAQTLSYFDGGTQRRSIGLALVEGIWLRKKRQLDVVVPVLVNQMIYLLLSSDANDAVHEERNAIRLLFLLERTIPLTSDPGQHRPEILDALLRRYGEKSDRGVGLPKVTLKIWFERLGGDKETLEAEQEPGGDKRQGKCGGHNTYLRK